MTGSDLEIQEKSVSSAKSTFLTLSPTVHTYEMFITLQVCTLQLKADLECSFVKRYI